MNEHDCNVVDGKIVFTYGGFMRYNDSVRCEVYIMRFISIILLLIISYLKFSS